MNQKTIKINKKNVQIFYLLSAVLLASILLYIYFINIAIFNTSKIQKVSEEITNTRSQISQLELELIDINRKITTNTASKLGLVPARERVFVERNVRTSLTLNELQSE
jgi:cell division protein FtsL